MPNETSRRPDVSSNLRATEIATSQNSRFLEAAMAAYAMIAHADGELAPSERRRAMMIARIEPRLSAFSHEEIVEEFAMHEANFALDNEVATLLAAEQLKPIHAHRRDAQLIVEACRALIEADGIAHPAEFRALEKVKLLLGLFESKQGL